MGRTILPFWFCPSEPRPSVWEQDGFSTGDPSYRGVGTSYAYKSRLTTDCPPNTPANCRGNLAAVPQAAIDNPAGIWLFWDADSDYSRHTDKSRGSWRGAPRLSLGRRHQRSNGSLRRWARQTNDRHSAPAVVREHGAGRQGLCAVPRLSVADNAGNAQRRAFPAPKTLLFARCPRPLTAESARTLRAESGYPPAGSSPRARPSTRAPHASPRCSPDSCPARCPHAR